MLAGFVLLAAAPVVADWESFVRAILVGLFVLIVPGWAILDVWDLARGWTGAGLAISLSLALATIVPGALLYSHAWSPLAALLILFGVTLAASVASAIRRIRGDHQ